MGLGAITILLLNTSAGFSDDGSMGVTISGRVMFHGPVPSELTLRVDTDQDFCGTTLTVQPLAVHHASHGVQDVVVSIDAPAGPARKEKSGTSIVTNRECLFTPRIGAARAEDYLEIRNDDDILHNTHVRQGRRTMINVIMMGEAAPVRKQIKNPGTLEITCDKHRFMRSYILTFAHPYFTHTDEIGRFQITRVPPGRREITIWHEMLGALRKEVEIPVHGDITVNFEFPTSIRPIIYNEIPVN